MQTLTLNEQEMVAGGHQIFDRDKFFGKIAVDPEAIRRAIELAIRGPGAVNFNIGRSFANLGFGFQPNFGVIRIQEMSPPGRDEDC